MLKYKNKINEHIDSTTDQVEKLKTWVQYDRVTKQEQDKILDDVLNKLNHISDLIDLEQG